ncbi:MAG TPA: ISL3 family transposase [Candidatus Tetragenococcus pullicola]|nr:ISL3 family transposase [Candidatus Tetragenococcus pullicola]
MLCYKDIKIKDEKLDLTFKQLLNIKDSRLFFSNQAYQKERVKGKLTNVFYGVLTYTPKACECCGAVNDGTTIIKHSPKPSDIQLLPFQEVPTILRLFKQRFLCKQCHHTFSAQTYYVSKNCYISQPLKFAIAVDLKKKISMKDIAARYFVSFKTVERVLDSFYRDYQAKKNYLPKHLLIDEFKGTRDCEGKMCFIFSDAETGKIIDILDDRRNFKLITFFQRFSLKARQSVQHVVMDMNAAYASMVPKVFPNATILIDHFHIIQQISRAFNQQRIRTQNRLNKNDSEDGKNYRKLKKYWKQLLKKHKNLSYEQLKQFPLFRQKFVTESEVVDYLLTIDPVLKVSYDVYQDLLDAFEEHNASEFFRLIDHLPSSLERPFIKSLQYLKKHRKAITLSFTQPYSNGKLEGKNNLIKVIQRIAFGFRTFKHLRKRVLIQQGVLDIQ